MLRKTVTVTPKQLDTLIAVRDRARAATGEKVSISEAEYQLAKKKFLALQASGAEIPEKALEIARRMGFFS